jgi:hypothetical protein
VKLSISVLLVTATVAAADPPAPSSPGAAVGVSLGVTAAGLGLVFVGADAAIRPQAYGSIQSVVEGVAVGVGSAALLVGPSLGRAFYAHSLWSTGLALRLIGVGVGGAGVAAALAMNSSWGGLFVGGIFEIVAGGFFITGATIEIATTPAAVRRHNATLLTIAPAPIRGPEGSLAPGLVLAGRF